MALRTATILLLVALCGCGGSRFFDNVEVVEHIGASRAASYVTAQTIKSYRVEAEYMVDSEGVPLKDWQHGFLDEFMPIEEVGPALDKDQRVRLLSFLGSTDTYVLDDSEECVCCYIEPEYGFEFCGTQGSRFVFIGIRCRQVYFRGAEGENVLLSVRRDATDLSGLLGELFSSN